MNSVRAIAALFVLGATVWGATGCNADSYGQPAAPTGPSVSPNAPDPLAAEDAGSAVDVSLGRSGLRDWARQHVGCRSPPFVWGHGNRRDNTSGHLGRNVARPARWEHGGRRGSRPRLCIRSRCFARSRHPHSCVEGGRRAGKAGRRRCRSRARGAAIRWGSGDHQPWRRDGDRATQRLPGAPRGCLGQDDRPGLGGVRDG